MYPSGAPGNRANLHQNSTTQLLGNKLRARTLLKVYANAGEYINVGSSAVGVGSGDIRIFNPGVVTGTVGQETLPAVASFQCSTQRASTANNNLGVINTRVKELAGPDTITNAVTGARGNAIATGYVPCYYQAPQAGVYDVYFVPPTPADANVTTTGEVELTSATNFTNSQGNTVAAWDVTVRSSLTSTANLDGRLFAYYAYMRHSANTRYAYFSLYPVTLDGYRYRTQLNGMDPNSWASFGNRSGFFNSDGITPLYHDILGSDDSLTTITGGASIQLPQFPMFFNPAAATVISALGIPSTPTKPAVSAFSFAGSVSSNNSVVGAGGTFTFTANVDHSYEIVISRDGVNFDPTNVNNRVLRGLLALGTNTVAWNGKDNSGVDFPVGTNYPANIVIRNGEYHFPMADVENSLGGPSITMINPPGGICPSNNCSTAFYDDRGYRLLNGTIVGTVNATLPGGIAPTINNSGVAGFDSTTNQRAFGNSSTGFGDRKGLDIWTYFPSESASLLLNILASAPDLTIAKTHTGNFTAGQIGATYNISVTNSGTVSTAGTVTVIDTVPTGLTATAAAGTGWTCSLNTPSVGQVQCTRTTALAAGSSYPPIVLTVNVAANAPASVTNSVTTSGGGETNTTNNTATDPTTILVKRFALVKRITAINGSTTNLNDPNNPLDDINLLALVNDGVANSADDEANWPAGYLVGAINAGFIKPGDTVEYTIYFLNADGAAVENVRICDRLLPRQTLVSDIYGAGADVELQLGSSPVLGLSQENDASDRTEFIAPSVSVPTTCNLLGSNDDGTLRVDVTGPAGTGIPALTALPGSISSGSPNDSYGRIRFRTRIAP